MGTGRPLAPYSSGLSLGRLFIRPVSPTSPVRGSRRLVARVNDSSPAGRCSGPPLVFSLHSWIPFRLALAAASVSPSHKQSRRSGNPADKCHSFLASLFTLRNERTGGRDRQTADTAQRLSLPAECAPRRNRSDIQSRTDGRRCREIGRRPLINGPVDGRLVFDRRGTASFPLPSRRRGTRRRPCLNNEPLIAPVARDACAIHETRDAPLVCFATRPAPLATLARRAREKSSHAALVSLGPAHVVKNAW